MERLAFRFVHERDPAKVAGWPMLDDETLLRIYRVLYGGPAFLMIPTRDDLMDQTFREGPGFCSALDEVGRAALEARPFLQFQTSYSHWYGRLDALLLPGRGRCRLPMLRRSFRYWSAQPWTKWPALSEAAKNAKARGLGDEPLERAPKAVRDAYLAIGETQLSVVGFFDKSYGDRVTPGWTTDGLNSDASGSSPTPQGLDLKP